MTAADWLLDALARAGVEVLFGNPGSTELPLVEALGRQTRVRYLLGLTEAAVIGMADGYAQQGRRLAVANVHVQPGMANALSGMLNAARARVPLLVTVGQQVSALLPSAPFLGGDVIGMARPVAKAAWEVARPEDLPELLGRAMAIALAPPAGPVVLSLPLEVQAGPAPSVSYRPVEPERSPRADVTRAVEVLRRARAPVVLAGDGVDHADAGATVGRLAERLGAPIYGEPYAARVPLATDHLLWRGPLPPFAAQIRPTLAPHDVVLAVGMPVFRVFGWSSGSALPAGARLVHLDEDPAEVGRTHPPDAGVVGDLPPALADLLAGLGPPDAAALDRCARAAAGTAADRRARRAALAAGAAGGATVTPDAFSRAVAAAVGPRDLVVDEALTSSRGLRTALGRRVPGTWLAHRGSALGWGLPAAVGAKLADPGRRVMCLHGDGSLVFGLPALWSAAHEGLPLALVIADNGGYEILRAGMEGMTGRPTGSWPGLALRDPALDWVALCSGMGASAERVERPRDLRDAFADLWARARQGPSALVVAVSGHADPVGYPIPPPG